MMLMYHTAHSLHCVALLVAHEEARSDSSTGLLQLYYSRELNPNNFPCTLLSFY
jgi:hypothetical protein